MNALPSLLVAASLALLPSARAAKEYPAQIYTAFAGSWACAVSNLGRVKCWGDNEYLQLGPDVPSRLSHAADATPLSLGRERHGPVVKLALGSTFGCALRRDQTVICWGSMPWDLVPLPTTEGRLVDLVAGTDHACALYQSGKVMCWGDNSAGQLAAPDYKNRYGDRDSPKLHFAYIGKDIRAVQIAAGYHNTCIVTDRGHVRCWGQTVDILGDEASGVVQGIFTPLDLGLRIPKGERIEKVALGIKHACLLTRSQKDPRGYVECWGANFAGELGSGFGSPIGPPSRTRPVELTHVELGIDSTDSIRDLQLGMFESCVFLKSGKVKCWGMNDDGQLGVGDKENRGTRGEQLGMNLPDAKIVPQLTAGAFSSRSSFSCALFTMIHAVKCWGSNSGGQLGLGDQISRGGSPDTIGNNLPYVDVTF